MAMAMHDAQYINNFNVARMPMRPHTKLFVRNPQRERGGDRYHTYVYVVRLSTVPMRERCR